MEKLGEVLAGLAAKLGMSMEELWPVIVAHTRLDAALGVVLSVLALCGLGFAMRVAARYWHEEGEVIPLVWLWFLAFLVVALCMSLVPDIVYPEIGALNSILGKLK